MKGDEAPPVPPSHWGLLLLLTIAAPPPRVLRGGRFIFTFISLSFCVSRGAGLFFEIVSLSLPAPCILDGLGFILYSNLLPAPSHFVNARMALLCFFFFFF